MDFGKDGAPQEENKVNMDDDEYLISIATDERKDVIPDKK